MEKSQLGVSISDYPSWEKEEIAAPATV